MKRRRIGRRKMVTVILAGSLLSGALAGCTIGIPEIERTERTTADYRDVEMAVTAAVPRVVGLRDFTRSVNGFGHAFRFGLTTDTAGPFTAEELDAVVEAVWDSLPWEPNTISITAGSDTDQGHEVVDLRAAAAELDPLGVTDAGTGGVSLTDMSARYGEWTAPQ